jgi:insulysin
LDCSESYYKNDPLNYISFLLGHEGENSLASLLVDEGLAEEVMSSFENLMSLFSCLELRISLT